MIKDRGTKKWTSLMLPEHIALLRELSIELDKEKKPILDEYQIQEFEEKIHYAMSFNLAVKLSVWKDGFTDVFTVHVHYIDSLNKQIRAKDKNEDLYYIDFADIVDIEVME